MKRNGIYLVILSVYLMLTSFSEGVRFRKIDMRSGLSYNSVLSVAEDHERIIWIGTREGLNRFNSVDNVIYKHDFEDSTSISNNHINCIYESPERKVLWIGTAEGLNRYNRLKNNFRQYLFSPDSTGISNGYVKCITEGFNHKLYIGTSNGLNIYNPDTDSFGRIFFEEPPTMSNNVISIYYDEKDGLWLGTKGGLYLWKRETQLPVRFDSLEKSELAHIEIRDIKKDQEGKYWVATEENGLYSFSFSNGTIKQLRHIYTGNSKILSDHIRKILIDNDSLWLGTLQGLCILNKRSHEFTNIKYSPENPDGISNSSVHDILKDHTGGYWLATYTGGINYYHPQNNLFPHFKRIAGEKNTLNSDVIGCFQVDKQGNLWLGTGNGGLNFIDKKSKKITIYSTGGKHSISDDNIKDLAPDTDGDLWVGTHDGLDFFDKRTHFFKRFYHDPGNPNSLNQNQVEAVWVDEEGLVWIGMNVGIFQMYDPHKRTFTNFPQVGNIVTRIFEDRKGRLWLAERGGLKCFDRHSRKLVDISEYTRGVHEQLRYINWIGEGSNGSMWIGTESSGLFVLKSGKTFHFNKKNGLIGNTVNAILEDSAGDFWISTNKGISKIKYTEDSLGVPHLHSVNFSTIHGLQGDQFEPGSAYKSPSGKFYFGGTNGYNAFFPEEVKKQDYFPPVVLSDFQINFVTQSPNQPDSPLKMAINETKELTLKYRERNISFKFAGINFVNPNETYYRYQLTDLTNGWVDLGKQRSLNFTYLPIGEHELRIEASTNHLKWGNEYKSVVLNVLPPWWQTWWAYLIYIAVLFLLLYIFFFYTQRWAHLKNELTMEQFKREKEQELHESKLKFFTDVSHELRTPLTLIIAPLENIMLQSGLSDKLYKQLSLIKRNGNRMMQLIEQVLNLRKLEMGHEQLQAARGNIVPFLREVSLAFSEIATARDIGFKYLPSVENLKIWYDRDKMEIIIYNLLSNAFKNTPRGGKVELRLRLTDSESSDSVFPLKNKGKFVEISVIDNGKGISEKDLKHIFDRFFSADHNVERSSKGIGVGLELTRRMVDLHKGKLLVESKEASQAEKGFTMFTVLLPLGKSHLTSSEMIRNFKDSEDLSRYSERLKTKERIGGILSADDEVSLPTVSDKEKQTLLIVEDNPEVRAFIHDIFRENYLVEEAGNGLEGLNIATRIVPDLVISDVMMPEMDGIELCRLLKSDVRTSHIPVILLTARTTVTFKYEGLETGADDYITKPFSSQYLMVRVKNLIKQRNVLRSHFQRQAIMEPKNITVTSVDEKFLQKAVDYITQNMSNPAINVETLSAELGLSRVHFYRKIKALTNLTAVDFIRSIRLKNAAMLLQKGKLNVKEIQLMVGFENADYFRRCFKSHYGMSPSDYAKKYS